MPGVVGITMRVVNHVPQLTCMRQGADKGRLKQRVSTIATVINTIGCTAGGTVCVRCAIRCAVRISTIKLCIYRRQGQPSGYLATPLRKVTGHHLDALIPKLCLAPADGMKMVLHNLFAYDLETFISSLQGIEFPIYGIAQFRCLHHRNMALCVRKLQRFKPP